MKALERIIIKSHALNFIFVIEYHVIIFHEFNPVFEGAMSIGYAKLVRKINPKAGGGITEGPNFGVLAMGAFRMICILPVQMLHNSRLGPFEFLIFIARYFPRLLPFVITRNIFVNRKNEIQPATKK